MNNKALTLIAIAIDTILLAITLTTGAWTIDQARFLLSVGIAVSSLVSVTGIVRWFKNRAKS